jgi:protein TonB
MPPPAATATDSEPAPVQLAEAPSAPKEPDSEPLPDPEMAQEPVPTTIDDQPVAAAPPSKPVLVPAAAPMTTASPAPAITTGNEDMAVPQPTDAQIASLPPPAPTGDDNAIDSDPAIAREPAFEPARYDVAALGNPKPDYPYLSRSRGEQGRVVLRVEVTATGDVASIEIADSSGHRRLDEAARDAVAQWRFEPARVGDDPIATTVNVPITFRIEN